MSENQTGDHWWTVDIPIQISEWECMTVEVRWHEPSPPFVVLTHVYQHPEPEYRWQDAAHLGPVELDRLIEALRTARDWADGPLDEVGQTFDGVEDSPENDEPDAAFTVIPLSSEDIKRMSADEIMAVLLKGP